MTLLQARILFTKCYAKLILFVFDQGYECADGQDGLKHMKNSLHYIGCAEDLLLYKNGVYLTKTEDYRFAGDYWKSLHPDCRWGGDFERPDGNHFSVEWGGRK